MDGVVVGDNVTLQNSVVGAGAVIEAKSNLNEVYVGSGVRVTAGKYQKEALA
jgi:NDP-sugar pyrophosphorylase family protein